MHLYGGTTTSKVKRKQNVHLNYLGLLLLFLRAYRHKGIAFWSNRGGNDTDDDKGNQVVAECVNETKERGL